MPQIDVNAEWLETDGLGGYASGTVGTIRSRRYHGLRVTAIQPPAGRVVLVAGCEVSIDCGDGRDALTSQRYEPDVTHPPLAAIESFELAPWPTWVMALSDGRRVRAEILCTSGCARTLLRWTQLSGSGAMRLTVRPLLAARDYHSLQHENPAARLAATHDGASVSWRLYDSAPEVVCLSNGRWTSAAAWYRRFHYEAERQRGLDAIEDLAAIGGLDFDLASAPAVIAIGSRAAMSDLDAADLVVSVDAACEAERARRDALGGVLERAADQYVVRRGNGRTVVAGYPWFTDWGRDTFIAMRGLCLATRRLDVARDILLEWATASSRGMLPNRFPDQGEEPEYNAVDASLWYAIVVGEMLSDAAAAAVISPHDRRHLEDAVDRILDGYARGTRFGIRADDDGLLAAGEPGVQLTWMDARVGDCVITPRIGKPVEVQALWINALDVGVRISRRWQPLRDAAIAAFETRFWNARQRCLDDVVDADHIAGRHDDSIRPNQILAIGGLPRMLLPIDRARLVVDTVERQLLTPIGLRSLSPDASAYAPVYRGGPAQRDAVYHQGTVWPWLLAPFVDAWLRVRGTTPAAVVEARARFLPPIEAHLHTAGLNHVSEVADGEAPHQPGGCPFQAWSVGELLRLRAMLDMNHRIEID